jgi:hypothetical protein
VVAVVVETIIQVVVQPELVALVVVAMEAHLPYLGLAELPTQVVVVVAAVQTHLLLAAQADQVS